MGSTFTTSKIGAPVRYAARNLLINGGFDVRQRGTSFSFVSPSMYTADRWVVPAISPSGGTLDVSRQSGDEQTHCLRIGRSNGATFTNIIFLTQALETQDSVSLAGKRVTLSFRARMGADFSSGSALLTADVMTGTGTDENMSTGAFPTSPTSHQTDVTLTTSWQTFSFDTVLASNANQVGVRFYYEPVGTAGAADYFEIEGIQLEEGGVATSFTRAGGFYANELALCYRYYYRYDISGINEIISVGYCGTTSTTNHKFQFPVTMRSAPSVSLDGTNTALVFNNVNYPPSGASIRRANKNIVSFDLSTLAVTLTQNSACFWQSTGTCTPIIADAEL